MQVSWSPLSADIPGNFVHLSLLTPQLLLVCCQYYSTISLDVCFSFLTNLGTHTQHKFENFFPSALLLNTSAISAAPAAQSKHTPQSITGRAGLLITQT